MGRPTAHLIEVLTGLGAGGLAGGSVGYATHQPEDPLEWLDENNVVQARNRSPEERAERWKRAKAAAGVGALIAAPASVLGGALRRRYLTKLEREALPEVKSTYLGGLGGLSADLNKSLVPWPNVLRNRERARKILAHEEKVFERHLEKARKARLGRAWGGPPDLRDQMPHETLRLEGSLNRRYEWLRKRYNLPHLRENGGRDFYRALLQRTYR